ncbi:hypothetical protein ACTLHX_003935 [Enterobacter hormaechei]|uniref:hypothetical protein n=1 Tax=Enterobacter hormaechei TaxID=158836 RepID=UPI002115C1AA|nr:hypothetical protein [Enterobacter hormaechei]EKU4498604.1 hypothetical protein [Enterobacter hormaechei]
MSTFTKEQLIEKLQHRISVASGFPESEKAQMDLELARIALASLEAEHAGFIVKHKVTGKFGSWLHSKADWFRSDEYEVLKAYTAPPAPVSVPDERYQHLSELYHAQEKRLFKLAQRIKGASFDKYAYSPSQAIDVLESAIFGEREDECRAAMLQGAELVTTANKLPFEQWLSQQTGTIDVECGCVMTEVFFHWLRVAYEAGNYPVIPDGWVLVPIEPTYQMCEAMGLQWESPRFPDRYKAMLAAVKK